MRSAALLLLLIAAVGCGDELCDAAALEAALESGGEVRIGACQIVGKFVVPAGATLRGDGSASAIKGDGVILDLMGDATIDGLRIEVGTGIAVLGMASGRVTLNDLEISAVRGGAILGFDGVTSLQITDVAVRGPVTEENAQALPEEPTASDTALYGVAIANVQDARFERLEVGGFGTAGVIATQSQLTWTGGKSAGNVGIGAWIDGGSAKLEDVTIEDTWRGFRGVPTFGLASGRGASIETNRVRISLTDGGFGAIHDGGTVRHAGLEADTNDAGAIIAQRTDSFELMGGSELADNQFAGLMLVEATGVLVQDTMIRGTVAVSRTTGSWGTIDVGDGLLVVGPREGSRFERLDLIGNGRAGMLFDLMGTETSLFSITDVTVDAEGSGYGCVAQNGNLLDGWDSSVVRTGSAMANDIAFTGGLDIIAPLEPADLPSPALLVGVIGPCN